MKRLLAVTVGLLAGAALFLFVDLGHQSVGIMLPDEVELVPAEARPYRRLDRGWYQLKLSFRGRDFWGSAVYDVATDEHGFRVDDQRPTKPGSGSVIFLGDSFTCGVAPAHDDVVLMLDPSDVGDEATVWRDGDDHPFDRRVSRDDASAVARGRVVAAQSWRGRLRFTRAAYATVRYSTCGFRTRRYLINITRLHVGGLGNARSNSRGAFGICARRCR